MIYLQAGVDVVVAVAAVVGGAVAVAGVFSKILGIIQKAMLLLLLLLSLLSLLLLLLLLSHIISFTCSWC